MRITRHQMFMGMAKVAAMRSTCFRLNVGAILVQGTNVKSIGYNGAPSKEPHCGGNACQHFDGGACRVVHAERNALQRAGFLTKNGGAASWNPPCEMYITHSPCIACADLLIHTVKAVYFEVPYRDPTGLARLTSHPLIGVYRLQPSGFLIDVRSNELVGEES